MADANPGSLQERGGLGLPNRPKRTGAFDSNASKRLSVAFNIRYSLLPIFHSFFYGHTNTLKFANDQPYSTVVLLFRCWSELTYVSVLFQSSFKKSKSSNVTNSPLKFA